MIQSLHRALDILEYLAATPEGEAVPLNAIACATGLKAGTCSNLLKTLIQRGYVEQSGKRQGYRLGPMAHYLARGRAYRLDIVRAAEPLLAELAARVHESVVLSALHEDRLFELARAEGDHMLQLRHDLTLVENLYRAANGRLLLAYLDEEALERVLARLGPPGELWPKAESAEQLRARLLAIRERGHYVDVREDGVARASFPVFQDGRVVAALGIYAPATRFTKDQRIAALGELRKTAEEISGRL